MTIQSLLEPFAHFGVRLGLEPSRLLLERLGNPHEQVPVIHVAGSNGKGSVCAYLSSMLVEAGYLVGRYTSPHLIDWNERICINQEPIPTDTLTELLRQVSAIAYQQDPLPTQFELMTAVAWLYFAQSEVDVAVIEVGLGGRLDATNVCDRPLVSVITSISREHWQVLGSTLGEIAGEKAGILKPGCPAVIGPVPPEANVVIYRRAAELNCETTYPPIAKDIGDGWAEYFGIEEYELMSEPLMAEADLEDEGGGKYGMLEYADLEYVGAAEMEDLDEEDDLDEDDDLDDEDDEIEIVHMMTTLRYWLPLPGAIQRQNSAIAIAAIQSLRERGWEISDEAMIRGIAKTQWAGRLQWVAWGDRRILVDGAHNPAGAQLLREYVDSLATSDSSITTDAAAYAHPTPGKPLPIPPEATTVPERGVHWVMGMLVTKDHREIFTALLRSGDRLSLVPVPDHKSAAPHDLATLAREICPDLAQCDTYTDGVTALNQITQTSDSLIVLCGSLYLIGHLFKAQSA